jgi:hypothetical protein
MAARIRFLQLAIAVVNLSIVVLAFTSIWPFPSGDFKVDLPSASEVTWTYADGVVQVHAPYTIDNGGFYDVSQLTLSYLVTNYSHHEIMKKTINIGDIPAGTVKSSSLDFDFDLIGLYNGGAQWMVFNDDLLNFHVDVSCYYTMKLVKFDASYQVSVPWDALIRGYGISNHTIVPPAAIGDPMSVSVDYWLNTADLLRGLPSAQVSVRYVGDATQLGTVQTTVQLGGNHTQTVTMTIDAASYMTLYSSYSLELLIQVAGFTLTQSVSVPVPTIPGVVP